MDAVSFVVTSLNEPALCFVSAGSLKELCDANRTALAPHIAAFGGLHASMSSIPVRLSIQPFLLSSLGFY